MWITQSCARVVLEMSRKIRADDDTEVPLNPQDWILMGRYMYLMLRNLRMENGERIDLALLHGSRAMSACAEARQPTKAHEVLFGTPGLPGSRAESLEPDSFKTTDENRPPEGDRCSECRNEDRIEDDEGLWNLSESKNLTDSRIEHCIFMMGAPARGFGDDEEEEEDFGGEDLTGLPPQTAFQIPALPEFAPGALPGTEAAGSGVNGASQLTY